MLGTLRQYKHIILLVAILLLATFVRMVWINAIPMSLNLDELYYVIHAKSFFYTGKDLYQTIPLWKVFLFQYPSHGMPQAELPFLFQTLLSGFPATFFIQAVPNILMSVGSVFCLYQIGNTLFNRRVGLIAALCMAINPWSIFISRTSYEVVGAVFFILAGYVIILRMRGVRILFSIPLFVFAFYSYIGTKILIVPFLCIFFIGNYFLYHRKKDIIWHSIVVFFFIALSIFYYLRIADGSTARLGEIATPISPIIAKQVNDIRSVTIVHPFISAFINKYSVFGSVLVRLFFQAISPLYLFFEGDYISALGNQGLFYAIDFLFLLIGFAQLGKQHKRHFWIIIVTCLVATIPQLIHDATGQGGNFSPHIAVLIPFFILIIGYGIAEAIRELMKKKWIVVVMMIGILYSFQLAGFIQSYFFQYPFHNGLFNLTSHVMTQYVSRSKTPIVVYAVNPVLTYTHYIYNENMFTKENAAAIMLSYQNGIYTLGNVSFRSCDDALTSLSDPSTKVIDSDCGKKLPLSVSRIPRPLDGSASLEIYQDELCKPYELRPFFLGLNARTLHMTTLSDQEFCQTFIIH